MLLVTCYLPRVIGHVLLVTCYLPRVISHVLFGGKNVLNDMMSISSTDKFMSEWFTDKISCKIFATSSSCEKSSV